MVNPRFEHGLDGWTKEGQVVATPGMSGVKIGPGVGSVRQTYKVPGLRILLVEAKLHGGSPEAGADLSVECFDKKGRVVMDFKQGFDPKGSAGIYFKTQAFTSRIVVKVDSGPNAQKAIHLDEVKIQDDDRGKPLHAPEIDLDQYMSPIWEGDTVHNETALLFSQHGGSPQGRLLFAPSQILSVTDSTLHTHYTEGKDFSVESKVISRLPGSSMPMVSDSEIPKGDFPWLDLAGRHVLISYKHAGSWEGPTAHYAGGFLPETVAKLRSGEPLTIAAWGDSITLGINVSGYRRQPPYMPTWTDLFARQIGKLYSNNKVKLYNAGLGGMTADWGKDSARQAVASLDPDLVLVAFGMNDFWSYDASQFKANIEAILAEIRKTRPHCEFILIASMKFDPAYTADPMYTEKLPAYAAALKTLEGPGVAVLDMTTISDALYKAKSSKDLGTDPMHPDDFLARWYANGLVQMLKPVRTQAHTFFVSPTGDDSYEGTTLTTAWKSLGRVSQELFVPGDQVVFKSGATLAGSLVLKGGGTAARPVVIRTDGAPATIVSPKESAIKISSGGVEIRNLILEGKVTSPVKDGHPGILLSASQKHQAFVRIDHVDISGFGGEGIAIKSEKNTPFGFDDVRLSHVNAHQNFGGGISSEDGIAYLAKGYAHSNFVITDCDVSDNFSGSGIVLSGVDGAVVEFSRSFSNLGHGGGVGMWAWCAKNVTFRYCIAASTRTNDGGDGGGFDLDGGCVDCVVEHCLSFDNDGPGYMHCDYPEAPRTHSNRISDSISVDDGRKPKGDSFGFGFVTWGSGLDDCTVERNLTVVNASDPHGRNFGALFVSRIEGSKGSSDVLHVKGVFQGNSVVVNGTGVGFVRNGLPESEVGRVLFAGNQYRGTTCPFLEGDQTLDLNQWKAGHPKDARVSATADLNLETVKDYKKLAPRDLEKLFGKRE